MTDITYDDIRKANEAIQTISIEKQNKKTGVVTKKDYAEVNQRIKAYRMVYPNGSIITEMLSNENGVCVFRATVRDAHGRIVATGTAYEKENSSFINQTSYIENCETSAVGRALGMAGFGIDTSVASYEEVANAMNNQAEAEKIDDLKVRTLRERCEADGVDVDKLCKLYKVKGLGDLTMKKFMNIHENWDKITMGGGKNE